MKATTLKTTLLAALLIFFAATVSATCRHNGNDYPTGTQKGSKVCENDGYWR